MNKITPRHILIKISDKEKFLKSASTQRHDMCRGQTEVTADFSSKGGKQEDSGTSPKRWKNSYPARICFRNRDTTKNISRNTKASRLTLPQRLNKLLHIEGKWHHVGIWIHTKDWRVTEAATTYTNMTLFSYNSLKGKPTTSTQQQQKIQCLASKDYQACKKI